MAEFAHINLDDVWAGQVSVRHARVCVEQQFENPRARLFVAIQGGDQRFRGFDESARVGMATFDLLASIVGGFGAEVPSYPRPGNPTPSVDAPVEASDKRLFAPTIRDFAPDEFLRVLTGG